jgi:hypothetical protein
MSESVLRAPMALVKVPVPSARGMLLTDTFKLAGRSAMILDPVTRPAESPVRPGSRDRNGGGSSGEDKTG